MPARDASVRHQTSKIAVNTSWAKTKNRSERTANGRAAARGRFDEQARELHPELSDEEIAIRAEHLRKAHFQRMALKSSQARRARAQERGNDAA